ncbi:MAG: hypothetical protein LBT95_03090 [Treponema sp.]|jgi:hypothetical protein|nr:hypothetical protein [Treponema sp.]
MDDRKKTIRELENKRQETSRSVNLMLEDLGESLLVRLHKTDKAGPHPFEDSPCIADQRRLLKEIADSEDLIKSVETDIARLKEIERQIAQGEGQNSEQAKNLADFYVRLGELVLGDMRFEDFARPYEHQIKVLLPKIRSLEDRLKALEDKNSANVFSLIGKNAQSMVIRSFLGKNRENLRRLYEDGGEKFVLAGLGDAASGEIPDIVNEIKDKQRFSSDIAAELALLRGERRKIGDAFGSEGGPVKRIQALERHINHTREELRRVYFNFGNQAADPALREAFSEFFTADDLLLLERIERDRDILKNYEIQIERIKASLAIDEEKAEIEKLNRTIEEHKQRIAAAEKTIADLEDRIVAANRHIGELSLFLEETSLGSAALP